MTSEPETNPYAVSAVLDRTETAHPAPTFFQKTGVVQSAWFCAVAVNLPVPLLLGYSLVQNQRCEAGLIVAVALIWITGALLCVQWYGLMWRLMVGSIFTALSQFLPIAHMVIGATAMGISRAIFDPERTTEPITSIPEAFSTTLLTGLGVILLALSIGAALIAIFRIKTFDTNADRRIP